MKEIKKSYLHTDLGCIVLVTVDDVIYLPSGYLGHYLNKAEFEKMDMNDDMSEETYNVILEAYNHKF